jgi:chitodextrinase
MQQFSISSRITFLAALVLMLTLVAHTNALAPLQRDKKRPTTPRNLRVTGVTDWSVSLTWGASTDNSGSVTYIVQCSTTGKTQQFAQNFGTFTNGFDYRRTYSFVVYARDAAGNWSGASNQVTATLLPDTTPPETPVVSQTDIGPTHVGLHWGIQDPSQIVRYEVEQNGVRVRSGFAPTGDEMTFLQPQTTYTFRVRARDGAGLWSEWSAPFTVTTPAADPNDHTPPTSPPGLHDNGGPMGEEVWLFWNDSSDNVTPTRFIRYFTYNNGVLVDATDGELRRAIFYLEPGVLNTVQVFALDEAGNVSDPITLIYDLR